jgi:hypothetical protein
MGRVTCSNVRGFTAVQPGRSRDREERGGALGVIVASAKQPGFAAEHAGLDRSLGAVVFKPEAAVIEKRMSASRWLCAYSSALRT